MIICDLWKKIIWNVFCHICTMYRLLILLLLFSFTARGQSYFRDHFGGLISVVFSVGTHTDAFGLQLKGYYTDHFYQVNAGTGIKWYPKNFGERRGFWESRNYFGGILLAGKKNTIPDFVFDGLNHQTNYNLGVGYNYIFYIDNAETTQQSGGFALHFQQVSIYHENDIFSGDGRDRYRTGHFLVSYHTAEMRAGIGVSMWTGETRGAHWEKIHLDKCPNGVKILEESPYGKTSHGILFGSFSHAFPCRQVATIKIGVDSEHVRHAIQNRLIHDALILPFPIERKAPHYPMLDENGCPAFERDKTRKERLYFQFGANENLSF